MNDPARDEKRALVETSLERASEIVGDITGPVMERFYARCPEAREAFVRLGAGDHLHIEARMVENCLYYMMEWYGRPKEVSTLIEDTVPHHVRTLEVSAGWYRDMLEAALGVVMETIPDDAPAERQAWEELRAGVVGDIARVADW